MPARLALEDEFYALPKQLIWFTVILCLFPSLLNLAGIDFGWSADEPEETYQSWHMIMVCISSTIAVLTAILACTDYYVKKDISIPIVGVAIFCAACLDISAMAYTSRMGRYTPDLTLVDSFAGFISRIFHVGIILLGVGLYVWNPGHIFNTGSRLNSYVVYVAVIFILLTVMSILLFQGATAIPDTINQDSWIPRPIGLITLTLYLIAGLKIVPAFYKKYPSIFSLTLILSMLPAVTTQLHLTFGYRSIYDNHFFVADYCRIISYFIPFVGLCLNYFHSSRNEMLFSVKLDAEGLEKKRAQELLSAVLESSVHPTLAYRALKDENGRIYDFECIMFNKSAYELVSKSVDLKEGTRLSEIFKQVDEKNKILFEKYIEVAETGIPFDSEIYSVLMQGWFHVVATRIAEGITITYNDISALKQYENELERRIHELDQSNKELEQFAYIASHDLQEPLRKIRSFGERLSTQYLEKLDEKGEDYIKRMSNAAERMQVLIDDLLLFSRVSRTGESFQECDLNRIIKEVLGDLEVGIAEKNASIVLTELPVIYAIPTQMRQLFNNLISNALKFSKEGVPPVVNISSAGLHKAAVNNSEGLAPGTYNVIVVSDNGIGFDPVYSEKIFQVFQRLHSRNIYSGTGIGLAICKKITDTHNGTIKAFSTEGNGAIFTIFLPDNKPHRA